MAHMPSEKKHIGYEDIDEEDSIEESSEEESKFVLTHSEQIQSSASRFNDEEYEPYSTNRRDSEKYYPRHNIFVQQLDQSKK